MKKILFILVALWLSSCATPTSEKVKALNGYWSIDTVKMADGSNREFPFSNHMDHFNIAGTKGVKNRVSPTYDGKFINYGSPVPFKWEERNGELFLLFSEGAAKYEQQVVAVTENALELVHDNGTRYFYKRYTYEKQ